jgi:type VI secretion system protein ImpA
MSTIDIQALLAPVSDGAPAGSDLSFEPVYDEIKEARRADADYLSRGDWTGELKTADWRKVIALAGDALASRSKDLQIAAWLCEALTQQHGFAGARDGFTLIDGLLEQFWDGLFPEKDGEELDDRIGRLEWLDNNLPTVLRLTPMTGPAGESAGYGWIRWQESRDVDNLGRQSEDAMKQALAEGKINSELWNSAVNQTPAAFYATLQADADSALAALKALCARIDEKFGRDAPGLGKLNETMANIAKLAAKLAADKGVGPVAAPVEEAVAEEAAPATAAGATAQIVKVQSGPPETREEAIRRLQEIAEFFRRTEPHSPVAYIVEKAARWGTMRLDEWIREVVNDDSTRSRLKDMLGYSEP